MFVLDAQVYEIRKANEGRRSYRLWALPLIRKLFQYRQDERWNDAYMVAGTW